jgi:L-lysine exporter family protein LysE/ArgO
MTSMYYRKEVDRLLSTGISNKMSEFLATPLLKGFSLGAGLIIAIGAQNAFVLRQGLKRLHVFATASVCTLCDAILILLGVNGLGTLIASFPALNAVTTWGGVLFLLVYGLRAFKGAIAPAPLEDYGVADQSESLYGTVLTALALSLLNPHVYLDTVVLLGSVGAQYPANSRIYFAAGAMLASAIWFFSLSYGAAWLMPLFKRRMAWRVLDGIVGCIMWVIAASLAWSAV